MMPPLDAAPAPVHDGLVLDLRPPTPVPTPRAAGKRGRPRKVAHDTPIDIAEFDAVAATISSIPQDRRPDVRQRARELADQDARLSRGPLVLLHRLIDADWATGIHTRSLSTLAGECGVDRRTVMRGFTALGQAGHTLRRENQDSDTSQTTLPIVARAWLDICAGVGAGKTEVGAEKSQGRGRKSEFAPEVGAENSLGAEKPQGRGEKIILPSPDPWSDPRLLGWAHNEMDQEVVGTSEVARICEILAESIPDEFLRGLDLPLDAALVTDAGLYALRTLVAGVIVARFPTDDCEIDTTTMTAGAFTRVAEVIYSCSDDGPLESYERAGAILTDEVIPWRFTLARPQQDNGARLVVPDEEGEMLLALASTVLHSSLPAEKKEAQIRAAIAAAAC
jgi:hypothetical protein